MVSVPGVMPVTMPPVVMVALVLLLPQAPPGTLLVSMISEPTHTFDGPVMVPVKVLELTATTWVALAVPQLFTTVYSMVSSPAVMPVTMPVLPTVAVPLLLLQVPPGVPSVSVMVAPTQTAAGPLMVPAPAPGTMVMILVAVATAQPVLTV